MAAEGGDGDAAERFMRRMIGDERWEGLPQRTRDQRRAEGPALVAELRAIRAPAPAPYDVTQLAVPVLAAHGSESRPHHQETARALAAAAPLGTLAVVEGAGHGVHLTHPAAVADLVRRALASAR
jgi:pimeloyl-ACP methyl ester carboxylesterase